MDLLIYDQTYTIVGVVDTASSIIWTNRFRECGDFEIYVPVSDEMVDLLQIDRMVLRQDDNMAGIIEKVDISTDEENGDYLTVTGRCLRSILDRRIIWDQTVLTGSLENAMRQLVTDAYISPTIAARKYAGLSLAAAHGYTDKVSVQFTGTGLLDALEQLCASYNYGFFITIKDGGMVMDFTKPVDRTVEQEARLPVVFSDEYDNLLTTVYAINKKEYKSVALVAGEGEGAARRRTTVSRSSDTAGLARREMYVDARDLSSNEGEISDTDYMAQLAERGSTELSMAALVETMEGTVDIGQMYTYRTDYNLGDLVTVINRYGVAASTQVLEVMETWDENGYTCTPTFG